MNDFEVGDAVVLTVPYGEVDAGTRGTVTGVYESGHMFPYRVFFEGTENEYVASLLGGWLVTADEIKKEDAA